MEGGDTRNGSGAGVDEGKPVEFNEARAVNEVNALQTLLENRYKNKVRRQSRFGKRRKRRCG